MTKIINLGVQGLIDLLRQKHVGDIFITECKDGPSQCSTHLRMDVWTMAKSWANPLITAYEIKTSRADFVNDNKWHLYKQYCNEFYFVSPPDIISPLELPPEAGLYYVARTGTRLYCKKKAPRREITIPEDLYRYILMCRIKVTGKDYSEQEKEYTSQYWKEWLINKQLDHDFGRHVGTNIRKRLDEEVIKVQHENDQLKKRMERYDGIKEFLKSIGLEHNIDGYYSLSGVRDRVNKLLATVPPGLESSLKYLIESLQGFSSKLNELKNKSGETVEVGVFDNDQ